MAEHVKKLPRRIRRAMARAKPVDDDTPPRLKRARMRRLRQAMTDMEFEEFLEAGRYGNV